MSKAVVFWFNRKNDFIMCPPSPLAPPPLGFEKIECVHAHEVDTWSERLRKQEKRIREMTDEERENFEEPIRADMLRELRTNLANATDETNRLFLVAAIERLERRRALRKKETVETLMHCESTEGVAS